MSKIIVFIATFSLLTLIGCKPPQPPPPAKPINYSQELPPGTLALRKLSPSEYPDFSQAIIASNVASVTTAIDHSLQYLSAPSSANFFPYADITHERAVASLQVLKQIIQSESPKAAADGGRHFDALIRGTFEIYKSIGAPDPNTGNYTGQVEYTGYCTPIYNASLTRGGPYQYPLYKRPTDLLLDSTGEHASRKMPDGGVVSGYYTRRQIELDHVLDGQELVWLPGRFEAYVITIQGSARLRLPDGRIYEVGYNGNNGYPYKSPGLQMVAGGLVSRDHLAASMKAYFAAHPDAMDKYLTINDRDVFFTERPGGPFGKLNVPVTAFATIATDKTIYPRAMPAFVVASVPSPDGQMTRFRGLMLDQDAGGAIRAAGRCDIYMGIGPAAEQMAGEELNTGELYYLAIKPELMSGH